MNNFIKNKFTVILVTCLGIAAFTTVTLAANAVSTPTVTVEPVKQENQPEGVLAKVIDVEPVYGNKVVPRRVCRDEPRTMVVPIHRAVDGSGGIVGGIAGGVIGNRIGKGNGNIAATIGGVILGSMVGNNVETEMNRPYVETVYVRVCHTEEVNKPYVKGYNVTYLLNGKAKTTFMKNKPVSDQILLELAPVSNS